MNCHFVLRRECKSERLLSLAMLLVCLMSGCGKNPANAPGAAAPPAPPTSAQPAAAAPAPRASSKSPVVPAQPAQEATAELAILKGELLAELSKDFRGGNNSHPDSSGFGKWFYLSSQSPNPWESAQSLTTLEWNAQGGDSGRYENPEVVNEGRTTIAAAPTGGVILTPPDNQWQYAVARWVSGVEGEGVVQGKFHWNQPTRSNGMEILVLVDGIIGFRSRMGPEDPETQTFSVGASLRPGATIDLVVGMDILHPLGSGDSNATTVTATVSRTATAASLVPDKNSVAEVAQSWRTNPKRPIPKNVDVSSSIESRANRVAWYQKTFLEPFRRGYKGMPDSRKGLDEFMEHYCEQLADGKFIFRDGQLLREGLVAARTTKGDPLAFAVICSLAQFTGNQRDGLLAMDMMRITDRTFPTRDYPPEAKFWFQWVRGLNSLSDVNDIRSQQVSKTTVVVGSEAAVQAASRPDLTNHDRQMLLRLMEQCSDPDFSVRTSLNGKETFLRLPCARPHLVSRLAHVAEVDPWIREMTLAREHHRLAWLARGDGFANTVTADGWIQFRSQIGNAKIHALNAWRLHPELPEAAALMISVSMAGDHVAGEDERFWFDEALRADASCTEAYDKYAWSLRPRWGGSHDKMLALGRECLASERFETSIPGHYEKIIKAIGSELGGLPQALALPGVSDDYVKLVQGYQKVAQDQPRREELQSGLAAVMWLAGKKEDARRILEELGPNVKAKSFLLYGVTYTDVARALRNETRKAATFFPDDPGGTSLAAFSPDGDFIWRAAPSGELSVWNAGTRRREQTMEEKMVGLASLQPHAKSERMLAVSGEGKVVIWAKGKLNAEAQLDLKRKAHAACWQVDGSGVAIACGDQKTTEIVFWDLKSQAPSSVAINAQGKLNALAVADGGKQIYFSVSAGEAPGNRLRLYTWDQVQGPEEIICFNHGITAWKLSPDGKRLFVGGLEDQLSGVENHIGASLAELEVPGGTERSRMLPLPSPVTDILPLKDEKRVAACCSSGEVVICEPNQGPPGKQLKGCIRGNAAGLKSLSISANDSYLAALDEKGIEHVWPLDHAELGWKITTPLIETNVGGFVRSFTFSTDGQRLSVDSWTGGISRWGWSSGCKAADFAYGVDWMPAQASAFQDGKRVASLHLAEGAPAVLKVTDYVQGKILHTGALQGSPPTGLAVSPDSKIIAVGDQSGTITLYDGDSGRPLTWGALTGHRTPVGPMTFTADNLALVSSSVDGAILWWDLPAKPDATTKSPIHRVVFADATRQLFNLSVSPDGSRVAAATFDTTNVIASATGKLLYAVPGHFAVFSPDDKTLLTASRVPEHIVHLWDADSGQERKRLTGGHKSLITAATFSPDSKIVITGDEIGSVRAWDGETAVELLELPSK
jgi:WD40 repeat protein